MANKNKNDSKRVNHRNTKTLEEAVAHFIADVKNRLDEREKSVHPKSWFPLTDIQPYLDRLEAAYKDRVGDVEEIPRQPYDRSVKKDGVTGARVIEKHESYGLISISRVSGGRRLFGSSVQHQHFFQLRIYRGQRESGEWGEHFRTDGRVPIVEVHLSPAQFVEMITTMNMGEGGPCTISNVEGIYMETTPQDAGSELKLMAEIFEERLVDTVDSMRAKLKELDKLLEKKSFTKEDKANIRNILNAGVRVMADNAPHTLKVFGEHTEKMVAKGKLEVESFVMLAIQKAGIKSIKDNNGNLILGSGDGENRKD
jgi:hypothetical protein